MSINTLAQKFSALFAALIVAICLTLPILSALSLNSDDTTQAVESPALAAGPVNGTSHT